jgi:hypothetical protein
MSTASYVVSLYVDNKSDTQPRIIYSGPDKGVATELLTELRKHYGIGLVSFKVITDTTAECAGKPYSSNPADMSHMEKIVMLETRVKELYTTSLEYLDALEAYNADEFISGKELTTASDRLNTADTRLREALWLT